MIKWLERGKKVGVRASLLHKVPCRDGLKRIKYCSCRPSIADLEEYALDEYECEFEDDDHSNHENPLADPGAAHSDAADAAAIHSDAAAMDTTNIESNMTVDTQYPEIADNSTCINNLYDTNNTLDQSQDIDVDDVEWFDTNEAPGSEQFLQALTTYHANHEDNKLHKNARSSRKLEQRDEKLYLIIPYSEDLKIVKVGVTRGTKESLMRRYSPSYGSIEVFLINISVNISDKHSAPVRRVQLETIFMNAFATLTKSVEGNGKGRELYRQKWKRDTEEIDIVLLYKYIVCYLANGTDAEIAILQRVIQQNPTEFCSQMIRKLGDESWDPRIFIRTGQRHLNVFHRAFHNDFSRYEIEVHFTRKCFNGFDFCMNTWKKQTYHNEKSLENVSNSFSSPPGPYSQISSDSALKYGTNFKHVNFQQHMGREKKQHLETPANNGYNTTSSSNVFLVTNSFNLKRRKRNLNTNENDDVDSYSEEMDSSEGPEDYGSVKDSVAASSLVSIDDETESSEDNDDSLSACTKENSLSHRRKKNHPAIADEAIQSDGDDDNGKVSNDDDEDDEDDEDDDGCYEDNCLDEKDERCTLFYNHQLCHETDFFDPDNRCSEILDFIIPKEFLNKVTESQIDQGMSNLEQILNQCFGNKSSQMSNVDLDASQIIESHGGENRIRMEPLYEKKITHYDRFHVMADKLVRVKKKIRFTDRKNRVLENWKCLTEFGVQSGTSNLVSSGKATRIEPLPDLFAGRYRNFFFEDITSSCETTTKWSIEEQSGTCCTYNIATVNKVNVKDDQLTVQILEFTINPSFLFQSSGDIFVLLVWAILRKQPEKISSVIFKVDDKSCPILPISKRDSVWNLVFFLKNGFHRMIANDESYYCELVVHKCTAAKKWKIDKSYKDHYANLLQGIRVKELEKILRKEAELKRVIKRAYEAYGKQFVKEFLAERKGKRIFCYTHQHSSPANENAFQIFVQDELSEGILSLKDNNMITWPVLKFQLERLQPTIKSCHYKIALINNIALSYKICDSYHKDKDDLIRDTMSNPRSPLAGYDPEVEVTIFPVCLPLHYVLCCIIRDNGEGVLLEMNSYPLDPGGMPLESCLQVRKVDSLDTNSWQSKICTFWNTLWEYKEIEGEMKTYINCKVNKILITYNLQIHSMTNFIFIQVPTQSEGVNDCAIFAAQYAYQLLKLLCNDYESTVRNCVAGKCDFEWKFSQTNVSEERKELLTLLSGHTKRNTTKKITITNDDDDDDDDDNNKGKQEQQQQQGEGL